MCRGLVSCTDFKAILVSFSTLTGPFEFERALTTWQVTEALLGPAIHELKPDIRTKGSFSPTSGFALKSRWN